MATFTPNIPDATHTPSNDQPLIEGNETYFKESYGKDHNFTSTSNTSVSNPDGYHTVIHQTVQGGNPNAIAGINQIYAKNYTPPFAGAATDTQLFVRSGVGTISQMTGFRAQINGGWQWLGGTLMIWGVESIGAIQSIGTVTFTTVSGTTIPFPNTCFNVQLTPISTVANVNSDNTIAVVGIPTPTTFQWVFNGNVSKVNAFYWLAIGN